MRIYRYDRFEWATQEVFDGDKRHVMALRAAFLALQCRIRSVLFLVEEPGLEQSLAGLDHALGNFVTDEVEPIITLLENAQADLDKTVNP